MSLFNELRRRSVMRMAALYLVGAWAALQVADLLVGILELADGTLRILTLVLLAGFPVALIVSWFYELTPEGVRRDSRGDGAAAAEQDPGRAARLNYVIIGVLVLGLGVLLIDRYLVDKPGISQAAAPDLANAQSAGLLPLPMEGLAILPFENLSDDEENGYFAAGIYEEVMSSASRLLPVKVTSRTSVMRVDPTLSVPEIGRTLGVAYVMEGSVRRQGDRIRVTVQLIDARSDEHVWAKNFDATLDDVFRVQDEVAASIADELQVKLDEPETRLAGNVPTRNAEAYQLYLQALSVFKEPGFLGPNIQPQTRDRAVAAVNKLLRAVELDPSFAAAWAELSERSEFLVWTDRFGVGGWASNEVVAAQEAFALDAAQRAVTLDPTSPRALYTLARLLDWDEQLAQLEEVLRFDPNHVNALNHLAWHHAWAGESDIAREYIERAMAADPLDVGYHGLYAALMRQQGLLSQAMAHARKVEEVTGRVNGEIATILLEQNDLHGWILEALRQVYEMPSGDKMVFMGRELLNIDPSGEASERWLDFSLRFPDGGREWGLVVRRELAGRRGDIEQLEAIDRTRKDLGASGTISELRRQREFDMWEAGDREGFIASRTAWRDRLLEWVETKRGVDGYDVGFAELRYFQELAWVALSLGDRALADEMISVVVAYFDTGRLVLESRSVEHVARAIQHIVRDDHDAALRELEKAYEMGQDIDAFWRLARHYVMVDPAPRALFGSERFQALRERSLEKRRETLARLEVEAPHILYPDEELLTRLHEEWATDEWRATWEEQPRYYREDLEP